MDTEGVYIGRFQPMHIGHEAIIHTMLDQHGRKNCVVLVGSCNEPYSRRDMFSYAQRQRFIKTVFPLINVVGLPDMRCRDAEWMLNMDDMLRFAGIDPLTAIYYGGCKNEYHMQLFLHAGRTISVLDRNSYDLANISGSGTRECLYNEDWEGATKFLNPRLHDLVIKEGRCIVQTHAFDF